MASTDIKDDDFYKRVLNRSQGRFLEDLDTTPLIDLFIEKEFLKYTEVRDIQDLNLTSEKTREILKKVSSRGPRGYYIFKQLLKKTHQEHLVDYLDRQEAALEKILMAEKKTHDQGIPVKMEQSPVADTHDYAGMERIPDEKELITISSHIGMNWEILGPFLGVPSTTVDQIKLDNSTTAMRVYKLLCVWLDMKGSKATIKNLLLDLRGAPKTVNIDWRKLEKTIQEFEQRERQTDDLPKVSFPKVRGYPGTPWNPFTPGYVPYPSLEAMHGEIGRTRKTGELQSNEFGPDLSGKSYPVGKIPVYGGQEGSKADKGILPPVYKSFQYGHPDNYQVHESYLKKNQRHDEGETDSDEETSRDRDSSENMSSLPNPRPVSNQPESSASNIVEGATGGSDFPAGGNKRGQKDDEAGRDVKKNKAADKIDAGRNRDVEKEIAVYLRGPLAEMTISGRPGSNRSSKNKAADEIDAGRNRNVEKEIAVHSRGPLAGMTISGRPGSNRSSDEEERLLDSYNDADEIDAIRNRKMEKEEAQSFDESVVKMTLCKTPDSSRSSDSTTSDKLIQNAPVQTTQQTGSGTILTPEEKQALMSMAKRIEKDDKQKEDIVLPRPITFITPSERQAVPEIQDNKADLNRKRIERVERIFKAVHEIKGRLKELNKEDVNDILDLCRNTPVDKGGFGEIFITKKEDLGISMKVVLKRKKSEEKTAEQKEQALLKLVPVTREKLCVLAMHLSIEQMFGLHEDTIRKEYYYLYPYKENGSLYHAIQNDNKLIKKKQESLLHVFDRLKIMYQLAAAVEYLHAPTYPDVRGKIMSFDITSSNVVLDPSFNGRLIDFDSAPEMKHGEYETIHTCVQDAPRYIGNDYILYGIVMRELLTGLKPTGNGPPLEDELIDCKEQLLKRQILRIWNYSDKKSHVEKVVSSLVNLSTNCIKDKHMTSTFLMNNLKTYLSETITPRWIRKDDKSENDQITETADLNVNMRKEKCDICLGFGAGLRMYLETFYLESLKFKRYLSNDIETDEKFLLRLVPTFRKIVDNDRTTMDIEDTILEMMHLCVHQEKQNLSPKPCLIFAEDTCTLANFLLSIWVHKDKSKFQASSKLKVLNQLCGVFLLQVANSDDVSDLEGILEKRFDMKPSYYSSRILVIFEYIDTEPSKLKMLHDLARSCTFKMCSFIIVTRVDENVLLESKLDTRCIYIADKCESIHISAIDRCMETDEVRKLEKIIDQTVPKRSDMIRRITFLDLNCTVPTVVRVPEDIKRIDIYSCVNVKVEHNAAEQLDIAIKEEDSSNFAMNPLEERISITESLTTISIYFASSRRHVFHKDIYQTFALAVSKGANIDILRLCDMKIGEKLVSVELDKGDIEKIRLSTESKEDFCRFGARILGPHVQDIMFNKNDVESEQSNTFAKRIMLDLICYKLVKTHKLVSECYPSEMEVNDDKHIKLVCFVDDDVVEDTFVGLPLVKRDSQTVSKESFVAENTCDREMKYVDNEEELGDINLTLSFHADDLMTSHRNLEAVKVSFVLSTKGQYEYPRPCIVLYCRAKGNIPYGDAPFPKNLNHPFKDKSFRTDVREGFYSSCVPGNSKDFNKELVLGCSVGEMNMDEAASLGPFVNITDTNETCFLTVRHAFKPLPPEREDDSIPGTKVVQPSDYHLSPSTTTGNRLCGEVIASHIGGQIDAVLVKICPERLPTSGHFIQMTKEDLRIAGLLEQPEYKDGATLDAKTLLTKGKAFRRIIKVGCTTSVTKGVLYTTEGCVRETLDYTTMEGNFNGSKQTYQIKSQLLVESFAKKVFCQGGDSGSAVFYVDDDQHLYCIGMVIGMLYNDFVAVVTPIDNILKILGRKMGGKTLELKTFPEVMDQS